MAHIQPCQLLFSLKTNVEYSLNQNSPGVVSFPQIKQKLLQLLNHGLKLKQDSPNSPLVSILQHVYLDFSGHKNVQNYFDSVLAWLERSLLEKSLSFQLPKIVMNRAKLEEIYTEQAFMRNPAYVESLLLCVRSLEEMRPNLLAELDPGLFLPGSSNFPKDRSSSVPILRWAGSGPLNKRKFTQSCKLVENETNQNHQTGCDSKCCDHCIQILLQGLLEKVSTTPYTPKKSPLKKMLGHRRVYSDITINIKNPTLPRSIPIDLSIDIDWQSAKYSFEQARQNLLDARLRDLEVSMELERENTHLYMSEMLIAAVEQMKWRQMLISETNRADHHLQLRSPPQVNPFSSTSSGYVHSFDQHSMTPSTSYDVGSDSASDYPYSEVSIGDLQNEWEIESTLDQPSTSTATHQSPERTYPITWQTESFNSSLDMERPQDDSRQRSGSLLDLEQQTQSRSQSISSPEGVAASLLWHFSHKQRTLPADMEWLVSYRDAPQLLLPFPTDSPVSPDVIYAQSDPANRASTADTKVKLRGTFEWAPPRQQWIFSLHPAPKLRVVLKKQQFRCAGCGNKFDKTVYLKRARYCEYFGKFFCQRCHRGSKIAIPARIVHKWDFRVYPVSDFANDFLRENSATAVLDVEAINPNLYEFVKPLRQIRDKRRQLIHMWQYVRTCRCTPDVVTRQGKLREMFTSLPSHLLLELHLYSLRDLKQVHDQSLEKRFDMLLHYGRFHIEGCQLCGARGFICELCDKQEILFPFQSDRVHRCVNCGLCLHKKCFLKRKNHACPKCARIREREPQTSQEE